MFGHEGGCCGLEWAPPPHQLPVSDLVAMEMKSDNPPHCGGACWSTVVAQQSHSNSQIGTFNKRLQIRTPLKLLYLLFNKFEHLSEIPVKEKKKTSAIKVMWNSLRRIILLLHLWLEGLTWRWRCRSWPASGWSRQILPASDTNRHWKVEILQ